MRPAPSGNSPQSGCRQHHRRTSPPTRRNPLLQGFAARIAPAQTRRAAENSRLSTQAHVSSFWNGIQNHGCGFPSALYMTTSTPTSPESLTWFPAREGDIRQARKPRSSRSRVFCYSNKPSTCFSKTSAPNHGGRRFRMKRGFLLKQHRAFGRNPRESAKPSTRNHEPKAFRQSSNRFSKDGKSPPLVWVSWYSCFPLLSPPFCPIERGIVTRTGFITPYGPLSRWPVLRSTNEFNSNAKPRH